jgi:hypothetical protein
LKHSSLAWSGGICKRFQIQHEMWWYVLRDQVPNAKWGGLGIHGAQVSVDFKTGVVIGCCAWSVEKLGVFVVQQCMHDDCD